MCFRAHTKKVRRGLLVKRDSMRGCKVRWAFVWLSRAVWPSRPSSKWPRVLKQAFVEQHSMQVTLQEEKMDIQRETINGGPGTLQQRPFISRLEYTSFHYLWVNGNGGGSEPELQS